MIYWKTGPKTTRLRRDSPFGIVEMDISLNIEQFEACYERYKAGRLVQEAFPISAEEREFILTGITPEKWREMFGEPEMEPDMEADSAF